LLPGRQEEFQSHLCDGLPEAYLMLDGGNHFGGTGEFWDLLGDFG